MFFTPFLSFKQFHGMKIINAISQTWTLVKRNINLFPHHCYLDLSTLYYLGIMKLYLLFVTLCLVVAARASPLSDASEPRSLRNSEAFGEETIAIGGNWWNSCSCRQESGVWATKCVPVQGKISGCISGSCHCSDAMPGKPCKGSCK